MFWYSVVFVGLFALLVVLIVMLVMYYFLKWIVRDGVYEALVCFQREQEEKEDCIK